MRIEYIPYLLLVILILLLSYRNGDEEPFPRGYIVKSKGSPLIMDELMYWMQTELTSRMQLLGGAAFIDEIPISNVSRPCLEVEPFANTYLSGWK